MAENNENEKDVSAAQEEEQMENEPFKLRVLKLMAELVAPKDKKSDYGKYKYNYRSAESITEALKPLCLKYRILPSMREKDSEDGATQPWVKAIVTLTDVYSDESTTSEARVFVDLQRTGMSLEQKSGSALSYARKYAWGGLLLIDDSKDPDTNEYQAAVGQGDVISEQEARVAEGMLLPNQKKFFLNRYGVDNIKKITKEQYAEMMKILKDREATLEAKGKTN